MATDLKPVMNGNMRFSPYVASREFVSKEAKQRNRALKYCSILALILAVIGIETVVLVLKAYEPPKIAGYAAGYLFTAPAEPASFQPGEFYTQFRDTVEEVYHRTEKDSLPELEDFLGSGVRAQIDSDYTPVKKQFREGFVQTFTVLEDRPLGFRPTEGMQVDYRGIWGIRSTSGMATSMIYIRTTFAVGQKTKLNGTGWRLIGIKPISEDEFYQTERDAERQRRLGLHDKTK
jgi:hypothetical protein